MDHNDYNRFDLYGFDEEEQNQKKTDRDDRRRREARRKQQQRRRLRNRVIIVGAGVLILLLIILVISLIVRAVSGSKTQNAQATEAMDAVSADIEITETQAPTEDLVSITDFIQPQVKDDGSDGFYESSQYIWNKQSFSLFYGGESTAQRYAELMNKAASEFGAGVKTYSLIAPLHTEFGLPARFFEGDNALQTDSQADYMKYAYTAMDSSVIPVNPYNYLSKHCDEYIYFSSDHHWTGLGAYYAYCAFTDKAKLPTLNLSDCDERVIENFTGTFTRLVSAELQTDSVHYWMFPYDVPTVVTEESGATYDYDSCYYEYAEPGDNSYGVFLFGDKPLEVISSQSPASSGEKIVVIHESYGNAFIPYLTYNYDEVYSIDFRYWGGDLSDFCAEHGITNVLFLNNVMSSATQSVLDSIEILL